MAAERSLLFFDGGLNNPPALLRDFAAGKGLDLIPIASAEEVLQRASRSFPACLVLDARTNREACIELCKRIKDDPFIAIIPVAVLVPSTGDEIPTRGLEAGADEVVHEGASDREKYLRLDLLLHRAARDVSVHPTTRLPGTTQVEREVARRLAAGGKFALCYADLDHFKEFNDRYGYNRGDRVIRLLSIILRDIVRALAPGGYVGHIGGDDFLFIVPLEYMEVTCDEILELFDTLIPYQYTDEDRRTGYYLGRDRRGNIYRIPLMTLSIGVVTNQFQEFTHPAQVSERCAEMKSYAKTLPGSVYVIDRRQIDRQVGAARVSDRERERGRE
jgi:diguanylate cyclase (GGDEF)-like protein